MLRSLTVNNFILIDSLHVDFEPGFTIITGETGAGKSILLGALSLLQGAKADVSLLLDADQKCVVEGVFEVKNYQLENFFAVHDNLAFFNHSIGMATAGETTISNQFIKSNSFLGVIFRHFSPASREEIFFNSFTRLSKGLSPI